MEKDKTITELLVRLRSLLDFTLEIVDYWDADLCAVGLKKGYKLVYISTFNYTEGEELFFDYDLEVIDGNGQEKKFKAVKVGRKVRKSSL